MGSLIASFESTFAAHFGRKHCIMTTSGAAANLLALDVLGKKRDNPLKTGDKIVLPALCSDMFRMPGMQIKLADVDDTWNAEPVIPPDEGRLMVATSTLGNPGHLQYWATAANLQKAYLIEDCTQALGAVSRDKPGPYRRLCGTFGVLSTFGLAHGGAVLTDNDEMADLCSQLRSPPPEEWAVANKQQLETLEDSRKQRQQNLNNMRLWCQDLPIAFYRQNGIVAPETIPFDLESAEVRQLVEDVFDAEGVLSWRLQGMTDDTTPNARDLQDRVVMLDNPARDCAVELLKVVRLLESTLRHARG